MCDTNLWEQTRNYMILLLILFLGVEKNNDDARRILQRKTNHTDDPAEILRAEHRIRSLKHRERKPRGYTKKNLDYWENSIKSQRKTRKRLSYNKPLESIPTEDESTATEPPPKQIKRRKRKQPASSSKSTVNKKSKRSKK